MRRLFTVMGLFAMVASCGFAPKPKDGKLPCDKGCPSGYVCRADNRCWLTNAPGVDSGADSPAVAKDVAASELGSADGAGAVDGVSPEAVKDVSADTSVAVDVGIAIDLAPADTGAMVDTASVDGAGGSTVDAPGGPGGAGGAAGSGGAGGGASGSGGASGTGGSNADAAPDAPQGNSDAACVAETDQQMCTRLGKNCNAISGFDSCGQSRSITTCGTCTGTLVCGAFVANVCPTICVFDQSTFDNCIFDL
jgi:hypothetical protein